MALGSHFTGESGNGSCLGPKVEWLGLVIVELEDQDWVWDAVWGCRRWGKGAVMCRAFVLCSMFSVKTF